ncbi:type IV pilus modification protein PilV [Ferribacterium limneticum]|uniref:type IV pilus modification protein PilV n=1 Tax=Ferribacterium limneticum TaxID=76259 RepID=UPI001CF9BEE0|nr:type IV pilus modification protein PilV [Ferribacterium limneticum]UCV20471.1 type IV pilus modification protein PilV [Ferribacterium limneticum]
MIAPHISVRQGGMALLEAMISVVVLSVGLLGLAGLQLAGIKSNQVAYERSVATMHAYGVADRIRAGMDPDKRVPVTLSQAQTAAADWVSENVLFPGESVGVSQPTGGNQFIIRVTWTERCLETGCSGSGTRSFDTELLP